MDTTTRIGWFIMGAALGFGYATGARAIARTQDGRSALYQQVTHAPGTQACTVLSAQPDATAGSEYLDEGCHGAGSAPGGYAKVDDGFYTDGTREGDAWTHERSWADAKTDLYGVQCYRDLDPLTAPLAWEEVGASTPVDYYSGDCRGSVTWTAAGSTTYTAVVSNLTSTFDVAEIELTIACGAVTKTWRSYDPAPNPAPSISATAGVQCTQATYVYFEQDANDGAKRTLLVRTETRRSPTAPSGGCGLGLELLALPAWWAMRRRQGRP